MAADVAVLPAFFVFKESFYSGHNFSLDSQLKKSYNSVES